MRPHLEYCYRTKSSRSIKKTNILERVQGVGTKLMEGLSKFSNDERPKRLKLFLLSHRETQGDLVLSFRKFTNDLNIYVSSFFSLEN